MATPQIFYTGVFSGYGNCAQSGFVTFSVSIETAFEAQIPIKVYLATNQVSAAAYTTVYRSTDAGATWESTGSIVQTFPSTGNTNFSTTMQQDLALSRGLYLVSICSGQQPGTTTCFLGTCEVVSAYS